MKVETDQGIHGIGEAYSCGPDEATVAAVQDFKRWLVGQEPRNIEHLWATMYNFTRFPGGLVVNAAMSGIEHALWDIAGKAAGLPVYMLLGGKCREKIRVYQSAGGGEPKQVADNAKGLVEKYGYTAVKMSPHQTRHQCPAVQLRHAHGGPARARRSRSARSRRRHRGRHSRQVLSKSRARSAWPERSNLTIRCGLRNRFVPRIPTAMAKLADHVNIPLASGECNYTKFEFCDILAAQALDIIQPDICVCGGLMEMKKIAAMAEAHYVMVAPHNPDGTGRDHGQCPLRRRPRPTS